MTTQTHTCGTCGAMHETQNLEDLMREEEMRQRVATCPILPEWIKGGLVEPLGNVDYTGLTLVLRPDSLGERYRRAKFQLVEVTGGFGCKPDSLGTKVYGTHLADGEEAQFRRSDFIGIATPKLIEYCAADKAGPTPIAPDAVGFLAIGRGAWAKGATEKEAKSKLRKSYGCAAQVVYRCHKETQYDGFSLTWPKASTVPCEAVWQSKAQAKKGVAA